MGRENVRRRRAERDSVRGGKLGHAIKIALAAKEAEFRGGYPRSQNVIFGLSVTRSAEGMQLLLDPSYGVGGTLTAEAIRVEIEPGKPTDKPQK